MLRLFVLVLLLANAGLLAWGQGWLAGVGLGPVSQAEPQRVAQQLRPEAMRILTGADASLSEPGVPQLAGAPLADECLQAGLFTADQAGVLRTRLQTSLPTGSWTLEPATDPGSWLVYMGKYNNPETFATKRSELRRLGVVFEVLPNGLGPALSLGQYSSSAEAEAGLARVAARGVISARVLQERPPAQGHRLTLPRVDAPLKAQLETMKPLLEGKPLEACR